MLHRSGIEVMMRAAKLKISDYWLRHQQQQSESPTNPLLSSLFILFIWLELYNWIILVQSNSRRKVMPFKSVSSKRYWSDDEGCIIKKPWLFGCGINNNRNCWEVRCYRLYLNCGFWSGLYKWIILVLSNATPGVAIHACCSIKAV